MEQIEEDGIFPGNFSWLDSLKDGDLENDFPDVKLGD